MISEVITKRLPALDDLRNGLVSEQYIRLNTLNIAYSHEEIQSLIFPPQGERILSKDLKHLVMLDDALVMKKNSNRNVLWKDMLKILMFDVISNVGSMVGFLVGYIL